MNKIVNILDNEYVVCDNHAEYLGCTDAPETIVGETDAPCALIGCPNND